jgi:uncharacterized protein
MRIVQFLIFFGIVLTVYSLINYYIFSRGLRTFEAGNPLRPWYIVGFIALSASFILGRVLEKVYLSHLSDLFTWAGSFWLAAMLYLFLIVLVVDLVRLADYFFPFLHHTADILLFRKPYLITISAAATVFLLVLAGHINAISPVIREVKIKTGKPSPQYSTLTIAMASDIHLGTIVGKKRIEHIVDKINSLDADIILLAGDIVDEDLAPVIHQNLGNTLSELKAPLGVFAVTGNHEYIGGAEKAVAYLQNHGIKILSDTAIKLFDNLHLAGREDFESRRYEGFTRKSISEIMRDIPDEAFTIMMDHQPVAITEASEAGVGLLLCGHTHHGQLWPLNFVTDAVFLHSYGLGQFGKTMVYVSNGVGSWGPPVRIGNRPEIVRITLQFEP